MTVAEKETQPIAYGSAATFITTLDHLHAVGTPNVVDRNALPPSFSGSSKYETLTTFRFFRLIDKDGKPNRDLLPRVVNPETREAALLDLLKEHYASLFALPLATAGPTEVNRWFSEHASPSVVGKSRAFFLAMAKQVGVSMHSMVSKGTRVATGSVRRKRRPKKASNNGVPAVNTDAADDDRDDGYEEPRSEGETRTVKLRGGAGTVSVSMTVNLWDLEGDDLKFVMGLIKDLKDYERGSGANPSPRVGAAES